MINLQLISLSSLPFYNLDDDQFRLTLYEFMNGGTVNFDPDRLAQLKFNPLLCECYKNFSFCKDNDLDMNFYLENSSCEYYTEDSFNNMLAEEQSRLNLNCGNLESGLSFLHMNIRSISNKFDKLTNFLSQLRMKLLRLGLMLIVIIFPILRVTTFCINLESIALVEVLAFTLVNI